MATLAMIEQKAETGKLRPQMTISEIARHLCVSRKRIKQLVDAGEFGPVIRIPSVGQYGPTVKIDRERFLEAVRRWTDQN